MPGKRTELSCHKGHRITRSPLHKFQPISVRVDPLTNKINLSACYTIEPASSKIRAAGLISFDLPAFAGSAPVDRYTSYGCRPARPGYARAAVKSAWGFRCSSSWIPGYGCRTYPERRVSLTGDKTCFHSLENNSQMEFAPWGS